MLCQKCKKREATVNHVEMINGKTCSLHLCDFCAQETYGEFEANVADAILDGLFAPVARIKKKVCPSCGMTFSEYERSGLLGCPSCYDVFKDELMPHIARMQGKTTHVGKGGGVFTSEHELLLKLTRLQEELESAIQCGDFAEASRLNEQIKALKKAGGVNRD